MPPSATRGCWWFLRQCRTAACTKWRAATGTTGYPSCVGNTLAPRQCCSAPEASTAKVWWACSSHRISPRQVRTRPDAISRLCFLSELFARLFLAADICSLHRAALTLHSQDPLFTFLLIYKSNVMSQRSSCLTSTSLFSFVPHCKTKGGVCFF